MSTWFLPAALAAVVVLGGTAVFFFTVTRGALIVRGVLAGPGGPASHVYPIYSNMRLIRLVDFQPVIAAILLFQYDRLVSMITGSLRRMDLDERQVLITSCAFGNVIPRVVDAAVQSGARQVQIVDIIGNELTHARSKLAGYAGRVEYRQEDAAATGLADGATGANVMFFLLHELPDALKGEVLKEACRVLAPGGKLFLAEFHRPNLWVLRALSWTYFKVFEPLSLALWTTHDPLKLLQDVGGVTCERRTVFFDNFQIIVATKNSG